MSNAREPWKVSDDDEYAPPGCLATIVDRNGCVVAYAMSKENGERIAACANFCRAYDTEKLKRMAQGETQ